MPIRLDPDMPEDEVRLEDSETGRVLMRITNVGKPQAIEPASIDKATAAYKFGIDHASAKPITESVAHEDYYASPLMRRLGYHLNPYTCSHHRKRMFLGSSKWFCMDCGSEV